MTLCFRYLQGSRPVPKIPVKLRYKGREVPVTALIDSGADHTFIPEDVTEILGIRYTRGEEKIITGIDKELKCIECSLTLILEKDGERHEIPVTAHVPKYSTKKVGVLLGRQGLFEHFNITFCEQTGDIYLEKTKEAEGPSSGVLREKAAGYGAKKKIKKRRGKTK